MSATRAICRVARHTVAAALAWVITVSPAAAASAAPSMRTAPPGTRVATESVSATEPFLPFSEPAPGAALPGADGEQYLAFVLAAVFFFLGLGYRMLANISDDRGTK